MYILAALVTSTLLYMLLVTAGPRVLRQQARTFSLLTGLMLLVGLVLFNFASSLIGIDLGPGRAVSYNIPDDYLALGSGGVFILMLYAFVCASPLIAAGLLQLSSRRRVDG